MQIIYTLGHSTHEWEAFCGLLDRFNVGCVLDVRSRPRSRWTSYSHPNFRIRLNEIGVSYLFLGEHLGGQPSVGPTDYRSMAAMPAFQEAIDRVISISRRCVVALLCSEHDPVVCHRFLLVSRALAARGADVHHILRDGRAEPHAATLRRLEGSFRTAPLLADTLSSGWAIDAQERRLRHGPGLTRPRSSER